MSVDSWTLKVKSLDQTTQSVTVSSSASVLQLKEAIQPVFDVASHRQRLIFQGKVLKDGKQLTEYANLQDGKIIHLVSRPADAPTNPVNDDPQSTNTPRGTTNQLFPGMFGPTEGYTFITVDANLGDLGENNSTITSLLGSLFGASGVGGLDSLRRTGASPLNRREREDSTPRSLFSMDMGRNRRPSTTDPSSSLFDDAQQYFNSIRSFETRITRVIAAMENIQANLEGRSTLTNTDLTWSAMTNVSSEQTQSIRSRLRANGTSETAQLGMTVSHLTDLMVAMIPRLRQLAQDLQAETATTIESTPELRRMVAIIRNFSMVHHAVGNIMAGSEDPSRRREPSPLGRTRNLRPRRQSSSPVTPAFSTSTSSSQNKRQTRSSTATAASSSSSSSSSSKRQKTSASDSDTKSTRKGKGKRRDDAK